MNTTVTTSERILPYHFRGQRHMFQKRFDEGCAEVIVGSGAWIDRRKIGLLLAFHRLDGRVWTREYVEIERWEDPGPYSMSVFFYKAGWVIDKTAEPVEVEYSPEEFAAHVQENQVTFPGVALSLVRILEEWARYWPNE